MAVESNPVTRARERIFDIDTAMRGNYDSLRAKVAAGLSPVLIVEPDLGGGTYTLICQGRRTSTRPVAPLFQLVKSVCHLPLGVYAILAPYLNGPRTSDWRADLESFQATAATALAALDEAELPRKAEQASRRILLAGIEFMQSCLEQSDFSLAGFKLFAVSVLEPILANMSFAAQALVDGVEKQLAAWREEMGERAWKELYAVILVIWTTEAQNQHHEILRRLMHQKTVDERLLAIGVGEQEADMVAVALDNLARIVQDNVAAGLILPTDSELAKTLAGTKDLLADAVDKIMKSCPRSDPHRRR
ncbi:MAG: hypothetical protein ACJ8ER_07925 [Allosphingosinicella sp.]